MLKVVYNALTGAAVPDAHVEKFVFDTLSSSKEKDVTVVVGSNALINQFRIAVKQGFIDHEQIRFVYKDQEMIANKHGNLDAYPVGFADLEDNQMIILLEWTA